MVTSFYKLGTGFAAVFNIPNVNTVSSSMNIDQLYWKSDECSVV